MLEVDTGTVDMVYSSSQHCGGDGRGRRRRKGGRRKGSRKAVGRFSSRCMEERSLRSCQGDPA